MGSSPAVIMKSCLLLLALLSAYCLAAPQGMPGGMPPVLGGIQHQNPEDGRWDANLAHYQHGLKNDGVYYCRYDVHQMVSYSTQVVQGELVRLQYTIKSPHQANPRRVGQADCEEQLCFAEIWKFMNNNKFTINCDRSTGYL